MTIEAKPEVYETMYTFFLRDLTIEFKSLAELTVQLYRILSNTDHGLWCTVNPDTRARIENSRLIMHNKSQHRL